MQTTHAMHDCVVKLLNNQDEESLECLCSLLPTMGKVHYLAEAKPRMDQYFKQIEEIVKEGKMSSRIRLMLQDIIDLRLHNWVSTGPEQGPKTMDHKEAKIEEQEEPRKVQQHGLATDTERRPDPSEQGDQGVQREEPWTTVPSSNKRRTNEPRNIPKVSKLINPGARQPPPSKIIVRQSVQQIHKLKTSENARKPDIKRESLPAQPISQGTKPGCQTNLAPPTTFEVGKFGLESLRWGEIMPGSLFAKATVVGHLDLFKMVRRILYKLTPQSFNQLIKQVMVLNIDTEERLNAVVDIVFEKAIDESSLSMPYGEICCCLATVPYCFKHFVQTEPSDSCVVAYAPMFSLMFLQKCNKLSVIQILP
ncbi:unnamed protein product [Pleuronectes platessa]|uniref:MIF4G domain-containing protein n=1 Tax=Pleuronectes platessa TaxID=8262 RepID=A0A9N7UBQ0_PLEPL|nr:unnamed protein product [Pleuronectes platessa]